MVPAFYASKSSVNGSSLLIWIFLSVALVLPIEIYLGGVFLRPILLGTAVVWIMLAIAICFLRKPVMVYSLNRSYFLCVTLLASFFIIQGGLQGRILVGLKETLEIAGSVALMLLLVKISMEIGIFRALLVLRNITFIGALLWVSSKFLEGEFSTYKDAYWIVLMASILSLIILKIRGNKFDYLIISILLILAVLSASRTLWAVSFVFIFGVFGAVRFILPAVIFAVAFLVVSSLDKQYSYYLDTLFFILNNYSDLIDDFQIVGAGLSNTSDKVRIIEAFRAFSVFLEHPFIGVGLDNYQDYITDSPNFDVEGYLQPHNEFLRVLAEGGIVLFCIYGLLYRLIWNDILKIPSADFKAIGQGLVLASLALAFFTATNYTIHFILQLALMCLAYYSRSDGTERQGV